ncbi:hypothetical protein FOL47_001687 [Perkinsus chesapeaki]|uniref:Uncharacterized protein n=1 Tax=Perkinsus chesapeaki TaxID=330153 RepID=A0A7J6MI42_PERCH|nr:hypothetical protein FOL47_001687 [Perkinsus chesapeaki]
MLLGSITFLAIVLQQITASLLASRRRRRSGKYSVRKIKEERPTKMMNGTEDNVELLRMARRDGITTMLVPDMPIERAKVRALESSVTEDSGISSPTLCQWNDKLALYDLIKTPVFGGFPKPLVLTAKEMDRRVKEMAEMFKVVEAHAEDDNHMSEVEEKTPSLLSLDIFNASIGDAEVTLNYFEPEDFPDGIAPLGKRPHERYLNLALFLVDEQERDEQQDKFLSKPLENAMTRSARKWAGKGIIEIMDRLKPTLVSWGLTEPYVSFGQINNDIVIALKKNRKEKACEGIILGNVKVNPYLHLLIDRANLGEWPLFYSPADYLAFAERRKDSELMTYDEVKDEIDRSGRIKLSTGEQRNLHIIDQVLGVMFTTPTIKDTPKKDTLSHRWVEAVRSSLRRQTYDFHRDD